MARLKICSCGSVVSDKVECSCKEKTNRNEYQRDYYRKNKEVLKPLSSTRWRKLRKLIISRDGGLCARCFSKYGIINGDNLQVHHIKPRIEFPHLMFDEENLITLCKTCNLQIGTAHELDFKKKETSVISEGFNL